jgi:hypothetical protein
MTTEFWERAGALRRAASAVSRSDALAARDVPARCAALGDTGFKLSLVPDRIQTLVSIVRSNERAVKAVAGTDARHRPFPRLDDASDGRSAQ